MFPPELTDMPNWLRWAYKEVNGKKTKIPLQVNGAAASTTDSNTWTSYDKVNGFPQIGFVFTKESGIVGLDLDHVITEGVITEWAEAIVRDANSYTEISPSGAGLHILGFGEKPQGFPNRVDIGEQGLEVYDSGRYFTMSGRVFENYSELRQVDIAKNLDFLAPSLVVDTQRKKRIGNNDELRISVHQIIGGFREGENRTHPFHGSVTGSNFMVDKGGETWRCWRHGCTGNALHLLGQKEGIIKCGDKPTKEQWRQIIAAAKTAGLIERPGLTKFEGSIR